MRSVRTPTAPTAPSPPSSNGCWRWSWHCSSTWRSRPCRASSRASARALPPTDRRDHRHLITVTEHGALSVRRLVAVHPYPRPLEHRPESRSVPRTGGVEELGQGDGLVLVARAAGSVTRLREQQQLDGQGRSSLLT